jgi:hypothetical protein
MQKMIKIRKKKSPKLNKSFERKQFLTVYYSLTRTFDVENPQLWLDLRFCGFQNFNCFVFCHFIIGNLTKKPTENDHKSLVLFEL